MSTLLFALGICRRVSVILTLGNWTLRMAITVSFQGTQNISPGDEWKAENHLSHGGFHSIMI